MSALLALSDVAVIRALERCYSRAITGDARRIADRESIARHHAYRRFAVPDSKLDHALAGSWDVLPELAWRWQLPVLPAEWGVVLDAHVRELLTSRAEHSLDDLQAVLRTLGAGHAA